MGRVGARHPQRSVPVVNGSRKSRMVAPTLRLPGMPRPYGACCRRVRMGRGEASPANGFGDESVSIRANGCIDPAASRDASPLRRLLQEGADG